MKNMPLKKVVKIAIASSISGFLLMAIGIGIGTASLPAALIVIIAGLFVLTGTIIFMALFYRCPYCGGFLSVRYYNVYCPHCGNYIT